MRTCQAPSPPLRMRRSAPRPRPRQRSGSARRAGQLAPQAACRHRPPGTRPRHPPAGRPARCRSRAPRPRTVCMNSRCSRWALLTRATVGRAMAARRGDLAGVVHAQLDHAQPRCAARRRSSVRGTPMSLLKLPCVARAASPFQARRTAAIICVTVVLPLLPVTAISGRSNCARQPLRQRAQGGQGVGHLDAGQTGRLPRHRAPWRPRRRRPGLGAGSALASKRSPFRATNRSPACKRAGIGVHARRAAWRHRPPGARRGCAGGQKPRACCSVIMGLVGAGSAAAPRRAALHARGPCRKTGGARPAVSW